MANPAHVADKTNSLGTYCQDCVPREETPQDRRFRLQRTAAKLLPQDRVSQCLHTIAPGRAGAAVNYSPSTGRAYLGNLITCNHLWVCPVCAQKITARRREELAEAIAEIFARGWSVVMVTYTVSHQVGTPLQMTLDGLRDARREFKAGRAWQQIKADYAIVGGINSLEITYGENGWHPHTHELMVIAAKLEPGEIDDLAFILKTRWLEKLNKRGFEASYRYGLDVRDADKAIKDYIAKWGHEPIDAGWTASDELTRSPVKRGHRDGLTPLQLLEAYAAGDKQAGALFIEYAATMEGRNQLVWSPGLRDLLNLAEPASDEEAANEEAADAVEMALIEHRAWARILKADARGELLDVASAGDVDRLRSWLFDRFGIVHIDLAEICGDSTIGKV